MSVPETEALRGSDKNFCRVLEVPSEWTKGYRLAGPSEEIFKMHDWFQPLAPYSVLGAGPESWSDLDEYITSYVREKAYVKPGNFNW